MLGFDNPIHLLFVALVVLLLFGAKRLPEMGRSMGAGIRGFKDALTEGDGPASLLETPPAAKDETPTAV